MNQRLRIVYFALVVLQPGCATETQDKPCPGCVDGAGRDAPSRDALGDLGQCEDSARCRRPPEVNLWSHSVWPDVPPPGPTDFQARVTTVDPTRFVLTPTSGSPISVMWYIQGSAPPFKKDQMVKVSQCRSYTMNGLSAASVRALDGTLLYAAAQGFVFPPMPFKCLPAEISYKHVDPGCCTNPMIKNESCGQAHNTGLRLSAATVVTVWTGDEGELEVGGQSFVVRNLYSFINNWSKRCSDNEDMSSAFAVARKVAP